MIKKFYDLSKQIYPDLCETLENYKDANYFCEKIEIDLPENFQIFIDKLNSLSVPPRYPDEIEKLLKDYKEDLTKKILKQTEELLLCLKEKLEKQERF